jgi:hypothetical protein
MSAMPTIFMSFASLIDAYRWIRAEPPLAKART